MKGALHYLTNTNQTNICCQQVETTYKHPNYGSLAKSKNDTEVSIGHYKFRVKQHNFNRS